MRKVKIVLCLVMVLVFGMIAGCGETKEVFLLTQPIYPTDLDPNEVKKMQAEEIERQKWEAEKYLQQHPTAKDKEEHPGPGVHVLTARF